MNIIKKIFILKNIYFGADIKNITFTDEYVIKEFKNSNKFDKTMMFYNFINDDEKYMFPNLIGYNESNNIIKTEYCGILLNLYDLPEDWEKQFINLKKFFIKNKIMNLNLKFIQHTPYVINNICIKDNQLYLIDLVLWKNMSEKDIEYNFNKLINQVKLYNNYKNYKVLLILFHIYYEIIKNLNDFIKNIKLLFVYN